MGRAPLPALAIPYRTSASECGPYRGAQRRGPYASEASADRVSEVSAAYFSRLR